MLFFFSFLFFLSFPSLPFPFSFLSFPLLFSPLLSSSLLSFFLCLFMFFSPAGRMFTAKGPKLPPLSEDFPQLNRSKPVWEVIHSHPKSTHQHCPGQPSVSNWLKWGYIKLAPCLTVENDSALAHVPELPVGSGERQCSGQKHTFPDLLSFPILLPSCPFSWEPSLRTSLSPSF